MLKVLQVRTQDKESYRFRNSKHARFDRSRRRLDWSIDRDAFP